MKPIEPVEIRTLERHWGEEIIIAETPHYLGKLLKMQAGTAGGLQYHRHKDESFYLLEGEALVEYDSGSDHPPALEQTRMVPGMAFHIPPGAPHRVIAQTDCVFLETSTPHYDDRVRCEEHYGVTVIGDEYGLPTTGDPDSGPEAQPAPEE